MAVWGCGDDAFDMAMPPDGEVKDIPSLQKTLREWMAELGKRTKVAVSYMGKFKTTAQMVAITLMLYRSPLGSFPTYEVGTVLLYAAAFLTLWSMVVYLRSAWPLLRAGLLPGRSETSVTPSASEPRGT